MKAVRPYLLAVFLFCTFFILTQLIETRVLFLGFDAESGAVIHNHKTSAQIYILVYGLSLWLSFLNTSRRVKSGIERQRFRLFISLLTIVAIYFLNFYLSKIIKSEGFNIYWDWRNNLGVPLATFTAILTALLTIFLEQIRRINVVAIVKRFREE